MLPEMERFYLKVITCDAPEHLCRLAQNGNRDLQYEGLIPRGFRCPDKGTPDILVVGKNPGHSFPDERDFLKGKRGRDLLDALTRLESSGHWSGTEKRSLVFKINLPRYLRFVLRIATDLETYEFARDQLMNPDTRDPYLLKVSSRVAVTNLFKCSTECETQRLGKQDFEECFHRHFATELSLLRPKLLIALGREVSSFLHLKRGTIGVPVLPIKHPSYFYRRSTELNELSALRDAVDSVLAI